MSDTGGRRHDATTDVLTARPTGNWEGSERKKEQQWGETEEGKKQMSQQCAGGLENESGVVVGKGGKRRGNELPLCVGWGGGAHVHMHVTYREKCLFLR